VSVRIEIVHDPDGARMDGLLAIYEASIAPRERKSAAAVRAMAGSPRHRVATAAEDGEVVGFSLLYLGEGVALLEYMAVAEARRGRGVGGALYRDAREAVAGRPLLIEIDSPREPAADQALRRRREAFYRRLGARRLEGLRYRLPLPGEGEPPEMDLLVDGADVVTRAEVADWLRQIYSGVYGCAPEDPRLPAMLASLPPMLTLS
jgi:predicted N-acetyltransferase YhbS